MPPLQAFWLSKINLSADSSPSGEEAISGVRILFCVMELEIARQEMMCSFTDFDGQ